MLKQFDTDEIEWYDDTTTAAMDHIARYLAENGHYSSLLDLSHGLYCYIAVQGYRPIEMVEDRFLKMMGVDEREK